MPVPGLLLSKGQAADLCITALRDEQSPDVLIRCDAGRYNSGVCGHGEVHARRDHREGGSLIGELLSCLCLAHPVITLDPAAERAVRERMSE